MNGSKKIIICGFGGQGILSLGMMLSYAAMTGGYHTTWISSYGPEMRGGTANCSVIYSDTPVTSPLVSKPNVLVVFNELSLEKFEKTLETGGVMLVNSDIVRTKAKRTDIRVLYIPVDSLVRNVNPKGANTVMFGALLGLFKDIDRLNAENAIEQVFAQKPQFVEINKKCLDIGMKYVVNLERSKK